MFDQNNLEIHTKNLSLNKEQEIIIREKIGKLINLAGRLNDESTKIKVEIDHDQVREKHNQIFCSVTIFAPDAVNLRTETHAETWRTALDTCKQELIPQIEKYKAKHG